MKVGGKEYTCKINLNEMRFGAKNKKEAEKKAREIMKEDMKKGWFWDIKEKEQEVGFFKIFMKMLLLSIYSLGAIGGATMIYYSGEDALLIGLYLAITISFLRGIRNIWRIIEYEADK